MFVLYTGMQFKMYFFLWVMVKSKFDFFLFNKHI